FDEPIGVDAGVDVFDISFGTAGVAGPDAMRNFRRNRVTFARRLGELALEMIVTALADFISLFAGDSFQFQKMLEITFTHRLALLDRTIHRGLREERLVAFVATEPPV